MAAPVNAYQRFLKTKRWQAIRERVLRRAGGLCESCLARDATEVHHASYRHGWLPPCWLLKAVCKPCHRALHAAETRR